MEIKVVLSLAGRAMLSNFLMTAKSDKSKENRLIFKDLVQCRALRRDLKIKSAWDEIIDIFRDDEEKRLDYNNEMIAWRGFHEEGEERPERPETHNWDDLNEKDIEELEVSEAHVSWAHTVMIDHDWSKTIDQNPGSQTRGKMIDAVLNLAQRDACADLIDAFSAALSEAKEDKKEKKEEKIEEE